MYLLTSILLSILLTNLSTIQRDSLAINPIERSKPDHSVGQFVSTGIPKDSIKTKQFPVDLKLIMQKVIQKQDKTTDVEIEIDGLLVNDTKTKNGNDFYGMFYDRWEAPKTAKNYSITVYEKPYQLTSSIITISINDEIVYQSILQPRQDLIESQTQEAIAVIQNYLANFEEIMKQMNGEDLGGSGIF